MGGIMQTFDDQNIPAQLDYFRAADAQRNSLLEVCYLLQERQAIRLIHAQTVVSRYEQLHQSYQDKCNDYENEVQSRRLWQNQYEASRREQLSIRQCIVCTSGRGRQRTFH